MAGIAKNLSIILQSIADCARRAGRDAGSVRLVAVSKFHPAEDVVSAIGAGQLLFGENRVQEAAAKFDAVRAQGFAPELHIIGALQRNKVKEAVRIASCIESVDRVELLAEIEKQCAKVGKTVGVLLELRTGEETKSGFADEGALRAAAAECASGAFPHVAVQGLMTMAPNTDDEGAVRASFRRLRALQGALRAELGERAGFSFAELSMGMSGDYPIAIEEGATIVRVGTAIFGARGTPA